ncbi:MAG: RpiB/LacA/LacB family sugar-phosphate isomerase, partial [Thermoguttaceae bacterium]
MNIAIGSDHHGAEFAKLLTRNLFLPNHYGGLDPIETLQPGAALIENACIGIETPTGRPRIVEIRYSLDKGPRERVAKGQGVDYPDIAAAVAEAVSEGRADRGVLICGTGIGMFITANKFKGVRAALCYNEVTA